MRIKQLRAHHCISDPLTNCLLYLKIFSLCVCHIKLCRFETFYRAKKTKYNKGIISINFEKKQKITYIHIRFINFLLAQFGTWNLKHAFITNYRVLNYIKSFNSKLYDIYLYIWSPKPILCIKMNNSLVLAPPTENTTNPSNILN